MRYNHSSVRFTQAAVWTVTGAVGLLLLCFPTLLGWYSASYRPLDGSVRLLLCVIFYLCAAAALTALWQMHGILRRVLRGSVFVAENVLGLRRISRCCMAVGVVCLLGIQGLPSLVVVSGVMVFLWLGVRVLAQVMEAAVAMREEADLTV